MNFSLKRRIAFSFVIANIVVVAIGLITFYHLNSLNLEVDNITSTANKVSLLTDEIRISAVSILKLQRKILTSKATEEDLEKLANLSEEFQSELQRLDSFYTEVEIKTIISKITGYVDSLKTLLSKVSLKGNRDSAGISSIGDLADKILESFSEFQDMQYNQNELRDKKLKTLIAETKKFMLVTLIITFLVTILLGLIIPAKIALPFKKINDAVREIQDNNFDVSIYYDQDDEIGELARELNKMIAHMKMFEELRADKLSVEHRKFDILANMVKKNVLVANADGELIYLNNKMYQILNIESEDVLHKDIHETRIPESIKETFELALKRRSKIENAEITITQKRKIYDDLSGEEVFDDEDENNLEEVFHGYANVVPIRARVSNLDYYMMILSTEVFV